MQARKLHTATGHRESVCTHLKANNEDALGLQLAGTVTQRAMGPLELQQGHSNHAGG